MRDFEQISFVLHGKIRGQEITPKTIPLDQFNRYNQQVQRFIVGSMKKPPLHEIHANIEAGSYRFSVLIPAIILATLKPDMEAVSQGFNLSGVDNKRIEVLEEWLSDARDNPDLSYEIQTAWASAKLLHIDASSEFKKEEPIWYATEKYLQGIIVTVGGATNSNIHLQVEGYQRALVIETTREKLKGSSLGKLYENQMVRVSAEENLKTGELRHLNLIEFVDYEPRYDEAELDALIAKATPRWADVPDASVWLREMRGDGEHES